MRLGVLILLLAGCASAPSRRQTLLTCLDLHDRHPSYDVEYQHSYGYAGDVLIVKGTNSWASPNALFISGSASTGVKTRAVRIGKEAWVYVDLLGKWVDCEEAGQSDLRADRYDPIAFTRALRARLPLNDADVTLALATDKIARYEFSVEPALIAPS